jgi:hypothetical protein
MLAHRSDNPEPGPKTDRSQIPRAHLPDGARVHWKRDWEFTYLIAYGFVRKRRAVAALPAFGLQPGGRHDDGPH